MSMEADVATKKVERASLETLLSKPPRTKVIEVSLADDQKASILFRALGSKAYDDLMAAHPPTKQEKEDGAVWNSDTFPPALISACSVEPKIDEDSAKTIFTSEEWSRGELMDMFMKVVALNSEGINVPFT